jgi:hypothetical protein
MLETECQTCGVRDVVSETECQWRGVRHGLGGWRKTALGGTGDRGAHHKGDCVPSSV